MRKALLLPILAASSLMFAPPAPAREASAVKPVNEEKKESASDEKGMQARVDEIAEQVGEIRGEKFKNSIPAARQSLADFQKYVGESIDKQMTPERLSHLGKVAKALGLYRGPEIENFRDLQIKVATTQAAAYYDPDTKKFFVLFGGMNDLMMGTVHAHELTHALQDQRFGLGKFLVDAAGHELNDDQTLARQALVEGEATFVMTIWQMQKMLGVKKVEAGALRSAVRMQASMDSRMIRGMLKSGGGEQLKEMEGMEEAIRAMDEIPDFILESMVGVYMKGMGFVQAIQEGGWEEVDKAFSTYPPASSEQILHPEKWKARENPTIFAWPDFKTEKAFDGWEVWDANTLGEMQWRIIFEEHELKSLGKRAAEGWDGDLYAVLVKEGTPAVMLLTSWDSPDEAEEFAAAYRKLLKKKYEGETTPTEVTVEESEVRIVEGFEGAQLEAARKFMKTAKRTKAPSEVPEPKEAK